MHGIMGLIMYPFSMLRQLVSQCRTGLKAFHEKASYTQTRASVLKQIGKKYLHRINCNYLMLICMRMFK